MTHATLQQSIGFLGGRIARLEWLAGHANDQAFTPAQQAARAGSILDVLHELGPEIGCILTCAVGAARAADLDMIDPDAVSDAFDELWRELIDEFPDPDDILADHAA